tara:strand:- start:865 stop:1026 length:162 start_codon:yes stop_codon:yes gene_type:complete
MAPTAISLKTMGQMPVSTDSKRVSMLDWSLPPAALSPVWGYIVMRSSPNRSDW